MIRISAGFRLYVLIILISSFASCEYVSEDEPPCRDDCSLTQQPNEIDSCFLTYMEFYSYKLVKSMFNFAKVSVYAGLWATRNENANLKLFEDIFLRTLSKYNDSSILGNVPFEDLNTTAHFVYEKLKMFTTKREPNTAIRYESYPSLRCPVPCSYELTTWQTLFYISLVIFVLALVTILFYSVFLRKQYVSLRNRVKNSKFNKAKSDS